MRRKRLIAIFMAAVTAMTMAACGGKTTETQTSVSNETDSAIPEETVTLDVFSQLANYSGEQVGWFGQVMLDKFNVKLNIIPDPDGSGVYETRMESGNLGDIVIWGHNTDNNQNYQNAIAKGMLFDWEEDDLLSDYGPYIKEHMKAALEKNRDISGGTLYGYGGNVAVDSSDRQDFTYSWDLRWDLYKELGYPKINNLDDLIDVLAKMKEICPTDDNGKPTYGLSMFSDWDGDTVMFVKSLASAYYGYDEFGIGLYDASKQKFYPALEENGPYLKMLKFHNELYQKGLLDPDSMTQGFEGVSEDYQNGTAFWNIFGFLGSSSYNSDRHAQEGKGMYSLSPDEANPLCYGQNIYGEQIWSIGANSQYPELCMEIINWLSTPEGRMTMEYGPKDVCWYYDENGKTQFTELGRSAKLDVKTQMTDGYSGTYEDGSFKMNNTTWAIDAPNPDSNGETYNYLRWESFASEPQSDIDADWRSFTGFDTRDEYLGSKPFNFTPGTTYTPSARPDDLMVVWNQVIDCIKTKSWEAIYAKSDEEYDQIVSEMISQAKEYGYDKCVEFQENEAKLRTACEDEVK